MTVLGIIVLILGGGVLIAGFLRSIRDDDRDSRLIDPDLFDD